MMLVFVVLPLALLITAAAIIGFMWAARSGQFDDVDTPAIRMLFDEPAKASRNDTEKTERDLDE